MARTEMPTSIEGLRELALQQESLLDEKQSTIEANATLISEQSELIAFYREWKRLIDSQRFGSRSEKIPAEQGHLFLTVSNGLSNFSPRPIISASNAALERPRFRRSRTPIR